jgi:hypothetical protein
MIGGQNQWGSARVVSLIAMGRRIDGRAHYATAIQRNFRKSLQKCFLQESFFQERFFEERFFEERFLGRFRDRCRLADIRRRPICLRARSLAKSAGSPAAVDGRSGFRRGCDQSRRQSRPCDRRHWVANADQDDLASAGGALRYFGAGTDTDGTSRQCYFSAPGDQAGKPKDDGRLRAHGQRAGRSRQAASAGPLRDVISFN